MTGSTWALLALVGIGLVVIGNVLRARRTDNMGCLGHFFVQAQEMTPIERVLNRTGIAVFFVCIIASFVA